MPKPILFITVACFLLLSGCPVSTDPAPPVRPSEEGSEEPLASLVQRTLDQNRAGRRLSTETHGAWQILHGVLAYGDRFTVETAGGTQPAIQYLLDGGAVKGFQPESGDRLGEDERAGLRMDMQPSTKVGQGHRDQWLAVLSQCGLSPQTAIRSGETSFTVEDWVSQTEFDVPRNLEYEFSWTLIALLSYRNTSHTWAARDGNQYSIEDLVYSEVQQSIPDSVCGGTHRLIGLSFALNRRRKEQAPISEVWREVESLLAESIEKARQNQNPDGSYSVAYLHRPGWNRDLGESLGTTGHVLEFLAFAATDETLREPWVERSVRYVCKVLQDCRDVDLECGVLYHALHGLAEYQQRVLSVQDK